MFKKKEEIVGVKAEDLAECETCKCLGYKSDFVKILTRNNRRSDRFSFCGYSYEDGDIYYCLTHKPDHDIEDWEDKNNKKYYKIVPAKEVEVFLKDEILTT